MSNKDVDSNIQNISVNNCKNVLDKLKYIANTIPVPFYWFDLKHALLGANKLALSDMGFGVYGGDFFGKTAYDIYPDEIADKLINNQKKVIENNKTLATEEIIKDISTGKIRHYKATLAPLYDDSGKVIGIYGVSIEITSGKESEKLRLKKAISKTKLEQEKKYQKAIEDNNREKIFKRLNDIADSIPVPFYWFGLDHRLMGANGTTLEAVGFVGNVNELIGKTAYDTYPKEIADQLIANQNKVSKTNKPLITEEKIKDITTGHIKYYEATLAPLHDDKGKVIGTYGISIDTTAKKEADQLKINDEINKAKLAEQDRFKRIVSQAVHDIRSPLASMMMVIKAYADKMPEKPRTILNQATTSINAISDGLMEHWSTDDGQTSPAVKKEGVESKDDVILVALAVSQLLTSKHYEYQKSSISFSHHFSNDSHFSCIQGNLIAFKRMLSNVINNAIGAYDDEAGQVMCELEAIGHDRVSIRIIDHGKGMSDEVLNKVRNAVSVTSGKEDGHGIGLTQVHDTVQHLQGKLEVESAVGQGTTITLSFPQIEKPHWLANNLTFRSNDTIIVLDDDESIHQAWKDRLQQTDLQPYLDKHTVHFTHGQEAIDYIDAMEDKSHLFLLTDYELLKQPLNGIEVIETTKLSRTVLVTSHYDDHKVREAVLKVDTQLLPKQLAHEVPIRIDVLPQPHDKHNEDKIVDDKSASASSPRRSAKVVVVDDDAHFTEVLVETFQRPDCLIDAYNRSDDFLQHLKDYSLDTRIYLDYQLTDTKIGLEVAKQLHEAGYRHLYLLSGYRFENKDTPDYITVINKKDIPDKKSL